VRETVRDPRFKISRMVFWPLGAVAKKKPAAIGRETHLTGTGRAGAAPNLT
jgi:hypothetical protein